MLFECDRRPAQIEIGIGQKEGEYSLTFSIQAGLVQGVTRATAALVLVVLLLEYARGARALWPSHLAEVSMPMGRMDGTVRTCTYRAIVVQEQYL